MYFASAVLQETLNCFLLNHELIVDPKQKHLPNVIFVARVLSLACANEHLLRRMDSLVAVQ